MNFPSHHKIHKYFARRPHNVFAELIRSFSDENDIIVDPFCGGGVTIQEGLRFHRKVVGFDLNPLSTFIVRNMVLSNGLDEIFFFLFEDLKSYLRFLTGDFCKFKYKKKEYTIHNSLKNLEKNQKVLIQKIKMLIQMREALAEE